MNEESLEGYNPYYLGSPLVVRRILYVEFVYEHVMVNVNAWEFSVDRARSSPKYH